MATMSNVINLTANKMSVCSSHFDFRYCSFKAQKMPYCPLYARIFFIFKIFTIAYLGATPENRPLSDVPESVFWDLLTCFFSAV